MAFFNLVSQLQEGYLLLLASLFLQLSPDYLRKEIPVRFFFIFFFSWKRHKDLFSSLPVKGSHAVSYPLPVTEIKSSSNSNPGVDWKAKEGKAGGKMVSLPHAAVHWGSSRHSCPGVPRTQTTPSVYLASGMRRCWWKVAFWASNYWQHPPHPQQLGARRRRCASTRLGGRLLRSHVGCVGAAWGGRASPELSAWQGSPAKLPLTSGDGEQHSFIATASSLTAVWPHPRWLDPRRKIQLHCSVLPPDPALTVMLLGLLSSYLSNQNKKPHIHNVHMVVGEEGRLGKHCPKCISAGRLRLIVLFCGLFERTLFISRIHPHPHFLLSARFWPSTQWSSGIFGKIWFYFFFLVFVILTCSLLQTKVGHGVARNRSFPWDSSFACPLG